MLQKLGPRSVVKSFELPSFETTSYHIHETRIVFER